MNPEPAGYTWPWLGFINRMSLDSEPWTAAVLHHYGSAPWTAPAAPTNRVYNQEDRQETSQSMEELEMEAIQAFLLFPCLYFSSACFKMLAEQDHITSLT